MLMGDMNIKRKTQCCRLKDAAILAPHDFVTENVAQKDRMSELPDEIRLVILSFLGMKDAARTSILSKTWRYSWTYLLDLDFDAKKFLGVANFRMKRSQYVRWVNQVIKAHRAPMVKRFRIFYYLDATHACDIDRWVRFCSRKGVQELDLDCGGGLGDDQDEYYSVQSVWQLFEPLDTCKIQAFTNLRSFRAEALKISGALLEFMLSKCPLLETLCLRWCQGLGSLKVVGSSLKLKYLELMNSDVDKVIISAPNLVTIVYWGSNGDFVYKNAPSLVEVRFGGDCGKDMIDQLSCISFRMETLSISTNMDKLWPIPFPTFSHLKRLTLDIYGIRHRSILLWSHLIDACPSLRELKLELNWRASLRFFDSLSSLTKATNKIHLCLEEVHLGGFVGCHADVEFAAYLVKIAPLLKRFTMDTRKPISISDKHGISTREKVRRQCSKQCAEQLARQQFPPILDVLII